MLPDMLKKAKAAQKVLGSSSGSERNGVLARMERLVERSASRVLEANQEDLELARREGVPDPLLKRLVLTEDKLAGLCAGLATLRGLPDPLGQGLGQRQLNNGLKIERIRVPLGVIGLIYESRPGVTIEAVGITVKSGNAVILRGGHEALNANRALAELWRRALTDSHLPADAVQLVDDPDRRYVRELMHLAGLDLLIPRGGAELIQTVVREATVPVIETGVGNCHLYVDGQADLDMALKILKDGKLGNPAVCNAVETLLVDRSIKERFLPAAGAMLADEGVLVHGDGEVLELLPAAVPAGEEDWAKEYLGLELAVRVVDGVEDAVEHIERYGSHHSEAIVTNDYRAGQRFIGAVDAAVVYWNASTRFSDGFEFGLGAEVGISTQKLHARGPMGLEALTTTKVVGMGSGQTRDF